MTEENVHFYTLNVGQRDSHVIHFPTNQAALVIDPGNSQIINKLLHENLEIKFLPIILISHFDIDHMSGLNEVIEGCLEKSLKPGCIFFNDHGFLKSKLSKRVKTILDDLDELAETHRLETEYAVANSRSSKYFQEILAKLGIEGRIIFPKRLQQRSGYQKGDFNLFSVILYLMFANKKILYTGDLPYAGWKEVDEKEDLKSDVFKVPHHGGNISDNSGEDMQKILDRVNPNFALVSVGSENSHKHPLPEVIKTIVSHPEMPHLFCTQMTDQCSKKRHQYKEKVDEFYKSKLINKEKEYNILKMGNDKGTMCAGTIRITFNRNSEPWTIPSNFDHHRMLNTFFSTDNLLCRSGALT
jgi:competence protein ComEC